MTQLFCYVTKIVRIIRKKSRGPTYRESFVIIWSTGLSELRLIAILYTVCRPTYRKILTTGIQKRGRKFLSELSQIRLIECPTYRVCLCTQSISRPKLRWPTYQASRTWLSLYI